MYDKKFLQVSRLIPNQPNTPRPCGYNRPTDTFEELSDAGYFPDYFAFDKGIVLVDDTMICILHDGFYCLKITSVSPVEFEVTRKFSL